MAQPAKAVPTSPDNQPQMTMSVSRRKHAYPMHLILVHPSSCNRTCDSCHVFELHKLACLLAGITIFYVMFYALSETLTNIYALCLWVSAGCISAV